MSSLPSDRTVASSSGLEGFVTVCAQRCALQPGRSACRRWPAWCGRARRQRRTHPATHARPSVLTHRHHRHTGKAADRPVGQGAGGRGIGSGSRTSWGLPSLVQRPTPHRHRHHPRHRCRRPVARRRRSSACPAAWPGPSGLTPPPSPSPPPAQRRRGPRTAALGGSVAACSCTQPLRPWGGSGVGGGRRAVPGTVGRPACPSRARACVPDAVPAGRGSRRGLSGGGRLKARDPSAPAAAITRETPPCTPGCS